MTRPQWRSSYKAVNSPEPKTIIFRIQFISIRVNRICVTKGVQLSLVRPTKACFGWIPSNRCIFHHSSSFLMTLGPSSSAFVSFLSYHWLFNVATSFVNGPLQNKCCVLSEDTYCVLSLSTIFHQLIKFVQDSVQSKKPSTIHWWLKIETHEIYLQSKCSSEYSWSQSEVRGWRAARGCWRGCAAPAGNPCPDPGAPPA